MRETAGKWEMRKFRRNEDCVILLEVCGVVFFATHLPLPGFRFFSNCLCGVIIVIMLGCDFYGLALVKLESDLESLLYECILLTECTLFH